MGYFINIFCQGIIFLTLLSVNLTAHALQQIHNNIPGESIKVNISNQTLTRIAIRGDRINKIRLLLGSGVLGCNLLNLPVLDIIRSKYQ